jgi:hypothetical protein
VARKPEEAVAKFVFEADNKTLLSALKQNVEQTSKFNEGTDKTLKAFGRYEKESQPAIESFKKLGEASASAYENTEKLSGVSVDSYKKITGALEAASTASEVLDNQFLSLGARALGAGRAYSGFADAIAPAAGLFNEFANAGSAAEKTFLALDMAEKPLQAGLVGIAKGVGVLANRFDLLGDRGSAASKVLSGMSGALSGAAKSVGMADTIGDVFRLGTSIKGIAEESVPGVVSAFGAMTGPITSAIQPILDKMQTWEGRMLLLQQAGQKLEENQVRLIALMASTAVHATKLYAIGSQYLAIADAVKSAKAQLNNMNEAMGVFQAMGVDTSMFDFIKSLKSIKLGLMTNAEAAQEFFNITISGYSKLQEQLAMTNTLSAGQAAGMDNMGRAMLDLVNGPLKNQVSSLDATNALYNTMSAGISDLGEAQKFLTAGLKLSSATGADSAQTLEVLAKTQKAYGLSASEAATTAAKLNGVVEYGITTFPQLTSGLSRTASVARATGVGLDEMLGSVAALTQTMTTDDTLTGYASLLQAIASQGEQSASAVSELGVRFDVNRVKAVGLQQALSELYQASNGNVEVLKRIIPDSLAFQTALQLMTSASKDASANMQKIGEIGSESLDTLFDSRRESAMQRISSVMRGFNEIAADLGQRVMPMIESALGVMEQLRDWFVAMPDWMKNAIAGMAMFGLGARAVTGAVGSMVGVLGALAKSYLIARAAQLLLRGELLGELKIMREMITVNGDWSGALLRLFGIQGEMARRIQDVTGLTRAQYEVNDLVSGAMDRMGRAYSGLTSTFQRSSHAISEALSGGIAAAIDRLPESGQRFVSGLQGIFTDSELTVRDRAQRISDHLQSSFNLDPRQGRERVQEYLNTILENAQFSPQAREDMSRRMSEIFSMEGLGDNQMAEMLANMLSGIGERTEPFVEKLQQVGEHLKATGAPEAVQQAWERISSLSRRGANDAEEAFAQLELELGQVASPSLRQQIEARLDGLRSTVQSGLLGAFDSDTVEAARRRISDEVEQLGLDLGEIGDPTIADRLRSRLNQVSESFEQVSDRVREEIGKIELDGIQQQVSDTIPRVQSFAEQTQESLRSAFDLNPARERFQAESGRIIEQFSAIVPDIRAVLSNVQEAITQGFSVPEQVSDFKRAAQQIAEDLTSVLPDIRGFAEQAQDEILRAFDLDQAGRVVKDGVEKIKDQVRRASDQDASTATVDVRAEVVDDDAIDVMAKRVNAYSVQTQKALGAALDPEPVIRDAVAITTRIDETLGRPIDIPSPHFDEWKDAAEEATKVTEPIETAFDRAKKVVENAANKIRDAVQAATGRGVNASEATIDVAAQIMPDVEEMEVTATRIEGVVKRSHAALNSMFALPEAKEAERIIQGSVDEIAAQLERLENKAVDVSKATIDITARPMGEVDRMQEVVDQAQKFAQDIQNSVRETLDPRIASQAVREMQREIGDAWGDGFDAPEPNFDAWADADQQFRDLADPWQSDLERAQDVVREQLGGIRGVVQEFTTNLRETLDPRIASREVREMIQGANDAWGDGFDVPEPNFDPWADADRQFRDLADPWKSDLERAQDVVKGAADRIASAVSNVVPEHIREEIAAQIEAIQQVVQGRLRDIAPRVEAEVEHARLMFYGLVPADAQAQVAARLDQLQAEFRHGLSEITNPAQLEQRQAEFRHAIAQLNNDLTQLASEETRDAVTFQIERMQQAIERQVSEMSGAFNVPDQGSGARAEGERAGTEFADGTESAVRDAQDRVQDGVRGLFDNALEAVGVDIGVISDMMNNLTDVIEGARQSGAAAAADVGKQAARSAEQAKNAAIEAQLKNRGLLELPSRIPLVGEMLSQASGLTQVNNDLNTFETLLKRATGENLKLKNSFEGTNKQLQAVRRFTQEVLPALANSPLKDQLAAQAASLDNFFEQRLNVMRDMEAKDGQERLKAARLNAKRRLDEEKANLAAIEAVRAQAANNNGLNEAEKKSIEEQTAVLRQKTQAQVDALEAGIAEADGLAGLARERSKALEAIEKERAALERRLATYQDQRTVFSDEAKQFEEQRSQAQERLALLDEEITAINEQIAAKQEAAGMGGTIELGGESSPEDQGRVQQIQSEIAALEAERGGLLEQVTAREASIEAANREINVRQQSIIATDNAVAAVQREVDVQREQADGIRALNTSQELSTQATALNTTVAQSNTDAVRRAGRERTGLRGMIESVASALGMNNLTLAENTVGTGLNSRAQLTMAGAQRIAAGGAQGLNQAIAMNTISLQNFTRWLDVATVKQAIATKASAALTSAQEGMGKVAKSVKTIGAELWNSFGPMGATIAGLGALFMAFQDFIPMLGGAAKKSQEMGKELRELAAGTQELANAQKEAATTQRDLLSDGEEKYSTFLAKTYVVARKTMAGLAVGGTELAGKLLGGTTEDLAKKREGIVLELEKTKAAIESASGDEKKALEEQAKNLSSFLAEIAEARPDVALAAKRRDLESELKKTKESLTTAGEEDREAIKENVKKLETELRKLPVSWQDQLWEWSRVGGESIDSLISDVTGATKRFEDTMTTMKGKYQEFLSVKEDLLSGGATTEEGKKLLAQSAEERRSLTAAELQQLLELEREGNEERIKETEFQLSKVDSLLEKATDKNEIRQLVSQKESLQQRAKFLQEAGKQQIKYLEQTQGVLAGRRDSADFVTGKESMEARMARTRDAMKETLEAEGIDPSVAIAKFDELGEAVNASSEGQRRAADRLFTTYSAWADNVAEIESPDLDLNQLDADTDKYIENIDGAVEAGTIGAAKAAELYKDILDQQGDLLKPDVRADLQKRIIEGIPAEAERAIKPIQALIDNVNHQITMGTKGQVQGAQELFAAESQILQKRIQAQREYAAAVTANYGEQSTQAKEANKELLAMERQFAEQSLANRQKLLEAKLNELTQTENRAMALLALSEKDRQRELAKLVKDEVFTQQEADMLKVNSTKERVELQIAFERTRAEEVRKELATIEGDSPRRRELEQQLFASMKKISEMRIQLIQNEVAIRERLTEKAVLANQIVIDGIEREIKEIENRNRLLAAAAQLRQAGEQLDNFGIQTEVVAIEQAIGLQSTLNNLRSQPEYYKQAQALLDATGKAGKTELQLLEEKQAQELKLADQRHEQMLVQQEFDMTQLKSQMEMEKLRAKAAIQEAEIANLKALQAKFAAQAAVAVAIESGDDDQLKAAQLQVELAERGVKQSETQIKQSKENLGIVQKVAERQIKALEKQQELQRAQSDQERQQIIMRQHIEALEYMAELEREILDLRRQSTEAQISLAESTIALNSSLKNFADIPGYLGEAIAILEQGEGFEASTIALLDRQGEAIGEQKSLLEERAKRMEEAHKLESGQLEAALQNEARLDIAAQQRQQLSLRQAQELTAMEQERHGLMQAELDLLSKRADIERSIRENEAASLDGVTRMITAMDGLNEMKRRQRDLEQQIVDSETEALRMMAEMEVNPRKRKYLEESIAQTKLQSLRRAQEMQRNELEMTLRREEVELRISAIKNQAEQARAVASVQTAQAQLDRTRASGASQLEVRAAEAELQAALTNAIATGIEGAGIQEQLEVFDDYAETSREQLAVSQRMEDFAARGELANSRASFNQGRMDRRSLSGDIRRFYNSRTGIGFGENEGDFYGDLRDSVRSGGRRLNQLKASDPREQVNMLDSLLDGFSEGGNLESVLNNFSDRFVTDLESIGLPSAASLGTKAGDELARLNRADRPGAPQLAPPDFDRSGGRNALPENRQPQPQPEDRGNRIGQVILNNQIEIKVESTGEEGTEEISQKLKQVAIDSLYEATLLMKKR